MATTHADELMPIKSMASNPQTTAQPMGIAALMRMTHAFDPDVLVMLGLSLDDFLRDIARSSVAVFLLEVTEDGARIHAEVARRLGAVPAVQREDIGYIFALELLLCLGER